MQTADLMPLSRARACPGPPVPAAGGIVCLHDYFERQVDVRPAAPALVEGSVVLSYRELDERANQLAHYLRAGGVGPGALVGLFFERSAHPVIAILACLKAGAGYVPIDPVHPEDRIRHIVGEAGITWLLTEEALAARARGFFAGTAVVVDAAAEALGRQPRRRLTRAECGAAPTDLCYVIYTSGTTGRPKGVMAEHRNAVAYVAAFNDACGTGPADRVYQGFSLGFDGSVEEIWMALSNGSALVVGTKTTPRFGNDVARFLTDHGITYFSTVPTLLATITNDIPTLRVLVVSGEMCRAELVARWARPGLRMLNVYGPTEATVNTTVAECVAGRPVTIGRALAGYEVHLLDEQLRPVPQGAKGELLVGGVTLARGYLNRPDLTGERFIELALAPGEAPRRLYRTGDLARLNDDGELEIFGRIDGQVKVRGYRVELAEIEAVLVEHPQVRSACVTALELDGLTELAAYVVPAGTAALDRNGVLAHLRAKLPDYMVPGYLDVVAALPMLTSGKADRKQLPPPVHALVRTAARVALPETVLEVDIAAVWRKLFRLAELSVEDDFFLDLGGHSLLAAQMVTELRSDFGLDVAIRDAYRFPTVRRLAAHASALAPPEARRDASAPAPGSQAVFESVAPWRRRATVALQAVSLYLIYALVAAPFAALVPYAARAYAGQGSWATVVWAGIAIACMLWPLLLAVAVAAKWLLIGRYRPGAHPVWGAFYYRWWLARRLEALSGAGAFAGTPLMSLYYRLMGAKVGKSCTLDTALCGSWDLISIGDESSIGADTQLLGYRVEQGMLLLGRVDLGRRCFVGIHSAFGLDCGMGDDARLDDQSMLPDGERVPAGEARRGSPAQPATVEVPAAPDLAMAPPAFRRPLLVGAAHLALLYGLILLITAAGLPFLVLNLYVLGRFGGAWFALSTALSVPVAVVFYCFYIAALKKLVLYRARAGTYPVGGAYYLRKWFVDRLLGVSRSLLLPLYTTLYLPPWLRLLGAKIGARAELSTVWYFSPDLLDIGEESFFADGSILGGRRLYRGRCQVGRNVIGRRTFVGNSAILPTGVSLGDRCLLGVSSAPPAGLACVPDGTEWVGSPAFALPNRQKVGDFADAVTYRPTAALYAQRAVVDLLRILIPGYLALGGVYAAMGLQLACYRAFGWEGMVAASPVIGFALSVAAVLLVVALKVAVMGRFTPVIKPLWSMYVWLNEMVNGAYESIMAPALAPLLGTPFVVPFLRLIGVRIGRGTYIDSTLFSEWDLVEIGDYAAVNVGAIIQTHLFEDRVMKSSYLKIGAECSVGNLAVILYDTEMQRGATLGPLSLLMKGERQNAHTRWHGIPTVPAAPGAGVWPSAVAARVRLT